METRVKQRTAPGIHQVPGGIDFDDLRRQMSGVQVSLRHIALIQKFFFIVPFSSKPEGPL
jgi:hypothetical protein